MLKTEEIVRYVLGTSHNGNLDDMTPVKQMHIWLHVNHWRSRANRPPLGRLYFSRVLYGMRAMGLIERTYWETPCDGNMWVWIVKPNAEVSGFPKGSPLDRGVRRLV